MPEGGLFRRLPAVAVAAGLMLVIILAAVPAPARALSGETTIARGQALTVTYDGTKADDVLWWDWDVVGGSPNLSFWVWRGSFGEFVQTLSDQSRTLHNERGTGSSGHIALRDDEHTVVVWSNNSTQNATVSYHVRLNPPDLTVYYSLAALILLAPVVVIGTYLVRERRRKAGPDSGRPAK